MVSVWRRLIYSLLSVLTANVVFASALTLYGILSAGVKAFESAGMGLFRPLLALFLTYFAVSLGISVVGWVLATPLVVLAKKVDGWRFWMYLAVGAIFGPLVMIGTTAFIHLSGKNGMAFHWFSFSEIDVFALAVSTLTSLFFLLLVRRANHRAGEKQIPTES